MEKLFPELVSVNLDFVQKTIVPQIENPTVEVLVYAILENLKTTAFLLTDENADNKQQLTELWSKFTSDPSVAKAFEATFVSAINKIEDQNIREGLLLLTPSITKTLIATTDNVKPDGKQLETIWKDFVKSADFFVFIKKNIQYILERFQLPSYIINAIKRLIG